MEKIKEFFSDKGLGFYVTLAGWVITLVTLIVYPACYGQTTFMSWWAFIFLLGGLLISIALPFLKQTKWMSSVLTFAVFMALLFFIYGIYFYVSVVLVGIQASAFDPSFFLCVVLFALALVVNIVGLFLKPVKDE